MKNYNSRSMKADNFLCRVVLQKFQRLNKIYGKGILRFPIIFEELCRSLQIKKEDAWELLFILQNKGVIKIVPYQGVVVNVS